MDLQPVQDVLLPLAPRLLDMSASDSCDPERKRQKCVQIMDGRIAKWKNVQVHQCQVQDVFLIKPYEIYKIRSVQIMIWTVLTSPRNYLTSPEKRNSNTGWINPLTYRLPASGFSLSEHKSQCRKLFFLHFSLKLCK